MLMGGSRAVGPGGIELTVLGLDRHYPRQPAWSLRSAEAGLAWHHASADQPAWWRLQASVQGNQGTNLGTNGSQHDAMGAQTRALLEGGVMGRRWDVQLGYRLYLARGGQVEEATRSQFTPLGFYSDDADALSAGGFVQHRLDLAGALELDDWTVQLSGLGRLRQSDPDVATASYARTLHSHLTARRELRDGLALSLTAGVSGAETVHERSYTDLYGWLGLHWSLAARQGTVD